MALAGCATPASTWLEEPHAVVPVRWVRAGPPQSEVRDGACVLYMADSEAGYAPAERLVRACMAAGGLRAGAGDLDLHWHVVSTNTEMDARYASINGRTGRLDRGAVTAGFYVHPRPTRACHVVTLASARALGHELKHCYDGNWHL